MVEKRELGRIEFGPEGKHTASRMNPYDALAQGARIANRVSPSDAWHIWSEQEIDAYCERWEVDDTACRIALNYQQLQAACGRLVDLDSIADLARAIQRYGDERAESAIERYQEQGE